MCPQLAKHQLGLVPVSLCLSLCFYVSSLIPDGDDAAFACDNIDNDDGDDVYWLVLDTIC